MTTVEPKIPIEQWPAALLLLINEQPRTLRELCVELVGQDPGSGFLPSSMFMCIEMNRVRQAMQLWGLWECESTGEYVDGKGATHYVIRPCGRRAAEALAVHGPQRALQFVSVPEWVTRVREREAGLAARDTARCAPTRAGPVQVETLL